MQPDCSLRAHDEESQMEEESGWLGVVNICVGVSMYAQSYYPASMVDTLGFVVYGTASQNGGLSAIHMVWWIKLSLSIFGFRRVACLFVLVVHGAQSWGKLGTLGDVPFPLILQPPTSTAIYLFN